MLRLHDIANALQRYQDRYQFLDAFADDVDEIREGTIGDLASFVQKDDHPVFAVQRDGELLSVQLFPHQGIARFRLGTTGQPAKGDRIAAGSTLGGLLGTALGAASQTKEGLLGGLILGMLVGSVMGAATEPVERVLALQFDPVATTWQLYDGPFLRWAKRTLQPAQ